MPNKTQILTHLNLIKQLRAAETYLSAQAMYENQKWDLAPQFVNDMNYTKSMSVDFHVLSVIRY